ncbi:hypothetical protein K402DRAFT_417573 [Aulographum hederae CBS 113979]|uniref:Uncharacterized protein n=1 Tax=Aulographum hederae CBS 113979 TaxID=1176131 RepID=A0A6G1HCN2_9PEZI|nr:hypothetical protein K402DRAFT_417573 [Aulographum hederae CBS 113979]
MAEILEASTILVSPTSPMGQVKGVRLRILGHIVPVEIDPNDPNANHLKSEVIVGMQGQRANAYLNQDDYVNPILEPTRIPCLPLLSTNPEEKGNKLITMVALALKTEACAPETYSRMGLIQFKFHTSVTDDLLITARRIRELMGPFTKDKDGNWDNSWMTEPQREITIIWLGH